MTTCRCAECRAIASSSPPYIQIDVTTFADPEPKYVYYDRNGKLMNEADELRRQVRIARWRALCTQVPRDAKRSYFQVLGILPHGMPLFADGSTQCAKCHRLIANYDGLSKKQENLGWCGDCCYLQQALANPKLGPTK